MMRTGRLARLASGIGCGMLLVIGCDDADPPQIHYEDLGTGGRVLLPTSSTWLDPAIADGKADWHPFRKPSERPSGPAVGTGDSATAGGGVDADQAAEIRALVDEYNGLIGEATVDELLEYYVESQHDAVRPLLEAGTRIADVLASLRETLETDLPDAAERVDAAMKALESKVPGTLSIGELSAESDSVIVAKVLGDPLVPTCRFRLSDDEWFLEIPNLEALAGIKPLVDAAVAGFTAMNEGLAAETLSAQAVLEQLEAAAAGAGDAKNPAPDAAAEPPDGEAPSGGTGEEDQGGG